MAKSEIDLTLGFVISIQHARTLHVEFWQLWKLILGFNIVNLNRGKEPGEVEI